MLGNDKRTLDAWRRVDKKASRAACLSLSVRMCTDISLLQVNKYPGKRVFKAVGACAHAELHGSVFVKQTSTKQASTCR